jgi:glycosyltransferase involved in cell wall biosynthesis
MQKKILHIITSTDIGGAESMLVKYISNSKNKSLKHIVLSIRKIGKLGLKLQGFGVEVYTIPGKLNSYKGIISLHKLIKSINPVIIQSWMYHSDFLALFLGIFYKDIKVCWNIRSYKYYNSSFRIYFLIKILSTFSRFPETIIINSLESKKVHLKLGFRPKKWNYIPNGFDENLFMTKDKSDVDIRNELFLKRDVQIVGHVGRYTPEKDHDSFLEACKIINNSNPDVHYVLVGRDIDNFNQTLINKIHDLDLESNVHLLGERLDIEMIIPCFNILCSSSVDEAFPNNVGEAMLSGVPCIATRVGDTSLLIYNKDFLVDSKDYHAMANKSLKLLNMSQLQRKEIGLRGRSHVVKNFSIRKISDQYDKIYASL